MMQSLDKTPCNKLVLEKPIVAQLIKFQNCNPFNASELTACIAVSAKPGQC
jgi:hypothetical protein